MTEQNIVELRNITKSFGDTDAVRDMNLYVRRNEFVTFLGPSGCGKTTTLRLIAGFESPDEGRVFFEGRDITDLPPYQRKVNTVFQRYALFPHLNVFDNIAFGLKIKKMGKAEIARRVAEMLEMVGMRGFEKRYVDNMSGGQQQRVAIARALVNDPEVLLLDEPLGALDLKLRKDMQVELKRIHAQSGVTFIYVTHDQEEALTMSDTIVVMKDGRIQQIGDPQTIYNEPKTAFVANFIGESNILPGLMHEDFHVRFAEHEFVCVDKGFPSESPVEVVVRPEDIRVVDAGQGMLPGEVRSALFKGVHWEMIIRANGYNWKVHSTRMSAPGSAVGLDIFPDEIHIMQAGKGDGGVVQA